MKLCGLPSLRASAATMLLVGLLEQGRGVDAGAVTTGVPQNPVVPGGECVRMFHSKGDVGCFSLDKDGSRARLVSVSTAGAFNRDTLKENSIVLLPDSLFTTENVAKLNGEFIKGLLVYPTPTSPFNYDATRPQGKGTVDGVLNPVFGDYEWNPSGRGIMSVSLPYPVLEVESEAKAKEFLDLARKNENAPVDSTFGVVYRGAMDYYFGPAKMDSITCLNFRNIYGDRSPKCLPVGGQSAWGVKGDLSVSKPAVVAMASMDTNSFSHVYAPGANAGASGLVALLAAADALKTIPSSALKKHIVFAAFQGESYGFVGSRRFLSDLKRAKQSPQGVCASPITTPTPYGTSHCASPVLPSLAFTGLALDSIDLAVHVDQVAQGNSWFVHPNPNAAASKAVVDALTKAPSAKSRVQVSTAPSALPPGPLVSFLNDQEFGNASLASAVLAGYDAALPSTYHSRQDTNSSHVDAAKNIAQAAQVLAEALFASSAAVPGSELLASIQVNATLVAALWTCITTQWNCPAMQAISKPAVASMNEYLSFTATSSPSFIEPVTLYTSVYADNRMPTVRVNKSYVVADLKDAKWEDAFKVNLYPNAYETFTRAFLASALRDVDPQAKACASNKDCTKEDECVYPGVCAARRAYFHDALSPGLKREPTLGLYSVLDASMPLWTEPNWITLGTFVYPDPGHTIGYVTLGAGVVSVLVGYVLAGRFVAHFRKQKLL